MFQVTKQLTGRVIMPPRKNVKKVKGKGKQIKGKGKKKAPAKKGKKGGKKVKAPAAFTKKLEVDDELFDVIGVRKCTRAQIIKKIWDYVKKNKLQDPNDGRYIIPDDKLSKITGNKGKRMNGFTMAGFINSHLKNN